MQRASKPHVLLLRERRPGLGVDPRPGEPEVDEMQSAVFLSRSAEDEVARLDIAVDDALIVDVLDDVQLPAR